MFFITSQNDISIELNFNSLANAGRTLVGAWIETASGKLISLQNSVAPLWVRGLKPYLQVAHQLPERVAPLWVRGLKHEVDGKWQFDYTVAPLWVRGLKLELLESDEPIQVVAPLWVRGLKPYKLQKILLAQMSHPCGCVD